MMETAILNHVSRRKIHAGMSSKSLRHCFVKENLYVVLPTGKTVSELLIVRLSQSCAQVVSQQPS